METPELGKSEEVMRSLIGNDEKIMQGQWELYLTNFQSKSEKPDKLMI
ncbi:hypothetical protein B6N60_05169 [Richelia sinica FACHB-800]|uniref:Uncharacterized protein n=1 Tax=Richelia sinica FACHB-800 TaxID=1357546 RepID=A0A975TD18_9NOST|nr:hypothetical protein B6N60_05169 [Richelia sinica FACHB-800]